VNRPIRTRDWAGVDYYAELGITSGADAAMIDEAYRRRAKDLHPDRNPDVLATERFTRLSTAYATLRDPAIRRAYDDFRFRVDRGLLADVPGMDPGPAPAAGWHQVPHPPRTRRPRRTMPAWLRLSIGWCLVLGGVGGILWALFGELPSHTAGDTNLGVQITLGIMAAKLLAGGFVVIWYPRLRARWHRDPGTT
jgi:DnaJ domain